VKHRTLGQYVEDADEIEDSLVTLRVRGSDPPNAVEKLRHLDRLGLLTDEVVWALVGQAPIDPLGIYGAMKDVGVWAFSPIDFTVVQVLAKKGPKPVALMRLDLMSNDIVFVVLRGGQLVEHKTLEAQAVVDKLAQRGMTADHMLAWLRTWMDDAIAVGSGALS